MKITDKDDLRMRDQATLSWNDSEAKGRVIEVRRRNDAVVSVKLAGHPEPFVMVHEAVRAEEWGRPVWSLDGGERTVSRGVTGTASARPGQTTRRMVFRTDGVLGGNGHTYPWVDEFGNLLKDDEIVDFQPAPVPDYAAAVDAYTRHLRDIRNFAESLASPGLVRSTLLTLLDDGPKL